MKGTLESDKISGLFPIVLKILFLIHLVTAAHFEEEHDGALFEQSVEAARDLRLSGKFKDSIDQYRAILVADPSNEQAYYDLAMIHRQLTGNLKEAALLLDELLLVALTPQSQLSAQPGNYHQVLNERALLAWDMHDIESAVVNFRKAIEVEPHNKHSNFNYAAFLTSVRFPDVLRDNPNEAGAVVEEALECYERSLIGAERDSTGVSITNILNDYSLALQKLGRFDQALGVLHQALGEDEKSVQTHANLALLFREMGMMTDSMDHGRASVKLDPGNAALWHNFGLILQDANLLDEALEAWETATFLDPDLTVSLSSIGHAYGTKGNLTAATLYYKRALNTAVQKELWNEADSLRLHIATACIPHIYESTDHIWQVRSTYSTNLDEMLSTDLLIADPETSVGCGSLGYYIIYQGYDDRTLRQKLAQIYWKSSPTLRYEASHLANLPSHGTSAVPRENMLEMQQPSQIRVGFVSKFFFRHSVGLLTEGVICGLDRNRFSVTTLFLQPQPVDEVSKRIMACSDKAVDAGSSLVAAQMIIDSEQLDILVFTEIGMDTLAYFLAFSHLAKRTVFFWGHAITSGIATSDAVLAGLDPQAAGGVDYFVSSVLFETLGKEAQRKYTERLYLMDGLTTSFARPLQPRPGMTRAHFGLVEGPNLYLVPQTLYKLHPDFDAVIRQVLQQDPQGVLVMPEAQQNAWTSTLLQRMEASLGAYLDRVKIIRRMEFDEFQAMAQMANVVIDPFPLGGGRSSLEIFSTGTPIVLWYNRTSILQLTYGMYKVMDIDECCVAYDEQAFVDKIVAIGTNRTLENDLRRVILERNHLLYEQQSVVEEWEEFLEYILSVPRPLDAAHQSTALVAKELRRVQNKRTNEDVRKPISVIIDTDISVPQPHQTQWVRKARFGWESVNEEDLSSAERLTRRQQPILLHHDLLYALKLSFPNPYTGLTRSFIIEVWRGQSVHEVATSFALEADLDYTQTRWLHRLLERGSKVSSRPVVWTQPIQLLDPSGALVTDFNIIIHQGEDLYQAASWLAYKLDYNGVFINYIFQLILEAAEIDSGCHECIAHRNSLVDLDSMPPDLSSKLHTEGGKSLWTPMRSQYPAPAECITLGITSSKRYSLFSKTIDGLQKGVGAIPNDIICKVIVIDDASTLEDRYMMMHNYPKFEYILKDPFSRGHANCLNKLVSAVQTKYFMYMEDDWLFLKKSSKVIQDALRLLQLSSQTQEPLVQVILNDQSCRDQKLPTDYADPDNRCPHRSGWPRELDGIKYRLHEFAVLHPNHDIAYWPGFSLNPAVWNILALQEAFLAKGSAVYFNENDRLFESWFSMQVLDAGLNVAFLDEISFQHIGTKDSAYILNGFKRPWDDL